MQRIFVQATFMAVHFINSWKKRMKEDTRKVVYGRKTRGFLCKAQKRDSADGV